LYATSVRIKPAPGEQVVRTIIRSRSQRSKIKVMRSIVASKCIRVTNGA